MTDTPVTTPDKPQISKAQQRREYLGGLLILLCSAAIIFFISQIENIETSSGAPPATAGQRVLP
jgi:hypothetical protein